jgi:lipopolysaccharide export system permease protein
MKTIDWYILIKFLKAYLFVVSMILLVVVMINITDQNENFIKHQLGFREIAAYYLDYMPYIASLISPITVFIAVVFITSQLAQHTEIIAMLSSGVSIWRIQIPYLIGAFIIAVVSFYFGGWIIPDSNKDRVAFEMQYFKRPYTNTERDIHIKVGSDAYLYIQNYNNHSDVGYRFTLETIRDTKVLERLTAQRLEWQDDTESWKLKNWNRRRFDGMQEHYEHGSELDTTLRIHPKDFESDYNRFETLTITELNDYIDELRLRGADDIVIYEIEKYIRFTAPFAAFILTFIGLTVSARKNREGPGFHIALGFLLAFIYIIFYLFSRRLAEVGGLNPILAIWLPNIVFSAIGVLMYRSLPR